MVRAFSERNVILDDTVVVSYSGSTIDENCALISTGKVFGDQASSKCDFCHKSHRPKYKGQIVICLGYNGKLLVYIIINVLDLLKWSKTPPHAEQPDFKEKIRKIVSAYR